MIMSVTFCNGGRQPASQISQKDFISAFTFLRNGKTLLYVQFMVIRHKTEEVKQAEGKRSGYEKVSGNFCSQTHYNFAIGEEVVSRSRVLNQTIRQLWLSMGLSLHEISKAIS